MLRTGAFGAKECSLTIGDRPPVPDSGGESNWVSYATELPVAHDPAIGSRIGGAHNFSMCASAKVGRVSRRNRSYGRVVIAWGLPLVHGAWNGIDGLAARG